MIDKENENGKHRQPGSTTHSDPAGAPDPADAGAQPNYAYSNAGAGLYTLSGGGGSGGVTTQSFGTFVSFLFRDDSQLEHTVTAGEIVGWRCWLIGDDHELRSVFMNHMVWYDYKMQRQEGGVQDFYIDGPGIHAFKTLRDVSHYAEGASSHWGSGSGSGVRQKIIIGRVQLWGAVTEYERGWTGQFAEVLGFRAVVGPNWVRCHFILKDMKRRLAAHKKASKSGEGLGGG